MAWNFESYTRRYNMSLYRCWHSALACPSTADPYVLAYQIDFAGPFFALLNCHLRALLFQLALWMFGRSILLWALVRFDVYFTPWCLVSACALSLFLCLPLAFRFISAPQWLRFCLFVKFSKLLSALVIHLCFAAAEAEKCGTLVSSFRLPSTLWASHRPL